MKITQRLTARSRSAGDNRPVLIVCLGDSVTHGCFEVYLKGPDAIETVYDKNCRESFI